MSYHIRYYECRHSVEFSNGKASHHPEEPDEKWCPMCRGEVLAWPGLLKQVRGNTSKTYISRMCANYIVALMDGKTLSPSPSSKGVVPALPNIAGHPTCTRCGQSAKVNNCVKTFRLKDMVCNVCQSCDETLVTRHLDKKLATVGRTRIEDPKNYPTPMQSINCPKCGHHDQNLCKCNAKCDKCSARATSFRLKAVGKDEQLCDKCHGQLCVLCGMNHKMTTDGQFCFECHHERKILEKQQACIHPEYATSFSGKLWCTMCGYEKA